jgi:hypothetical protein
MTLADKTNRSKRRPRLRSTDVILTRSHIVQENFGVRLQHKNSTRRQKINVTKRNRQFGWKREIYFFLDVYKKKAMK